MSAVAPPLPDSSTRADGWIAAVPKGDRGLPRWRDFGSFGAVPGDLNEIILRTRPDRTPPSTAAGGGCEVVFAGELHNRQALLGPLRLAESASGADILLTAYLKWGDEAVGKLRGIFALVIHDGRRGTVLCARDPLGTWPLFYAETGDELLVSPSAATLVRDPEVSADPNPVWFADRIRHQFPDPAATPHRAVRRVMPGHLLRARGNAVEAHRYWYPIAPEGPVEWVRGSALPGFEELIDRKIGDYVAGRQAGVFLSGGLDSVTVAAIAREHSDRCGTPAPWGLSLEFSDSEADEAEVQRRVAGVLGIPLLLLPFDEAVGEAGLFGDALEMNGTLSAPLLNPWLPAYRTLARRGRAEGCEIILTGGGGDEWLTVSSFLAADLIRRGDLAGFIDLYRSKKRDYKLSHAEAMRCLLWTCGLRPLCHDRWGHSALWAGLKSLRNRVREEPTRSEPGGTGRDWFLPDSQLRREVLSRPPQSLVKSADYYFRSLWEMLDHSLISAEAEELFEYGRQAGVQILRPFWDAEMIEFLCRVPPRQLNSGSRSKGLVRPLLKQRFPDFGIHRQVKLTAAGFFRSQVEAGSPTAWERLQGLDALEQLGVVDAKALGDEFSRVGTGERLDNPDRLWALLNLEAWLRSRI